MKHRFFRLTGLALGLAAASIGCRESTSNVDKLQLVNDIRALDRGNQTLRSQLDGVQALLDQAAPGSLSLTEPADRMRATVKEIEAGTKKLAAGFRAAKNTKGLEQVGGLESQYKIFGPALDSLARASDAPTARAAVNGLNSSVNGLWDHIHSLREIIYEASKEGEFGAFEAQCQASGANHTPPRNCTASKVRVATGSDPGPEDDVWSFSCNCP